MIAAVAAPDIASAAPLKTTREMVAGLTVAVRAVHGLGNGADRERRRLAVVAALRHATNLAAHRDGLLAKLDAGWDALAEDDDDANFARWIRWLASLELAEDVLHTAVEELLS
ncbi:MAG: hypothetical protein ACR2OO_15840 [Thermomicrobiales bacterium]